MGIKDVATGFIVGEFLIRGGRSELLGKVLNFVATVGLEESDAGEGNVGYGSLLFDLFAVADQDGDAELESGECMSGPQYPGVVTFRENDTFGMTFEVPREAVDEFH